MVFKDLKVGDIIYVSDPKQWDKPIKKTIGRIVPDELWVRFYTPEGDYIGEALQDRSKGSIYGIFADFNAFKEDLIEYHKQNVQRLEAEMKEICEELENACHFMAEALKIEDED